MNTYEHDEIRDLLTLAAAGALDAEEQKKVRDHLRLCADCSADFAAWSRLAGALEEIPTPQAPVGLVERTRRRLEAQAAIAAERRQQRWLFFWLTVFAWGTTLLTWPLFQYFGDRVGGVVDLSWTHIGATGAWIGYMLLVGTIGALAAGFLGKRRMQEEQTI
ncbi:MAG TPA: zf-HC2 domain-containing protein [Candidatus Angelobacter sp.]|nr:zf-HC2 domain-containing protein [Candidatus Angelobacter sp.]